MRIPKTWVPYISKRIIDNLMKKSLIELTVSHDRLEAEVEALMIDELMVEDRLNEEVRGLLRKYESEIEKGRMDYRRLFDMTKQKLVKERNIVL